ncbi:hypothetical protein Bca4012_037489 [Brassica carinata]
MDHNHIINNTRTSLKYMFDIITHVMGQVTDLAAVATVQVKGIDTKRVNFRLRDERVENSPLPVALFDQKNEKKMMTKVRDDWDVVDVRCISELLLSVKKLEKINDANRQSRQLEQLADKMRDCKRLNRSLNIRHILLLVWDVRILCLRTVRRLRCWNWSRLRWWKWIQMFCQLSLSLLRLRHSSSWSERRWSRCSRWEGRCRKEQSRRRIIANRRERVRLGRTGGLD